MGFKFKGSECGENVQPLQPSTVATSLCIKAIWSRIFETKSENIHEKLKPKAALNEITDTRPEGDVL